MNYGINWCCVKKIEPPKPAVKTIEVKPPTTRTTSPYTKPAVQHYKAPTITSTTTRFKPIATPVRPPPTKSKPTSTTYFNWSAVTPGTAPKYVPPKTTTGVKISPFPKPTCPAVCPSGYVRVRL